MKFPSSYERKSRTLAQTMIELCVFQLGLDKILREQVANSESSGELKSRRSSRAADRYKECPTRLLRCQQPSSSDPNEEAQSQAQHLEGRTAQFRGSEFATTMRARLSIGLCVYFMTKYCLIRAVSSGALGENAKWLDCWILGRLRWIGRASKISEDVSITFVTTIIVIRLYLASSKSKKFCFAALEFLMSKYESLPGGHSTLDNEKKDILDHRKAAPGYQSAWRTIKQLESKGKQSDKNPNTNRYFTSRVSGIERGGEPPRKLKWILRPNRTPECWLKLKSYTVLMLFHVIFGVATIPIFFRLAIVGSVFTDFGYELAYPTCVSWIKREQASANSSLAYEHIYRVEPQNKLLADERSVEQLPVIIPLVWTQQIVQEWRPYNIARILVDILENALLYTECLFIFASVNYALGLNILDIALYSERISARLDELIERLGCESTQAYDDGQLANRPRRLPPFCGGNSRRLFSEAYTSLSNITLLRRSRTLAVTSKYAAKLTTGNSSGDNALTREICSVQAILHDHFGLVRAYNHFNSSLLACISVNWLLWTLIMCTWMASVKSRAIELEFSIIEVLATCYGLFFLAVAGIIHSKNMGLYRQITRLMALDNTTLVTKIRWTTLLKFYYPKPLFCFTLYSSTRISRLFCLKLISWVVSAFVVLGNFYYVTLR